MHVTRIDKSETRISLNNELEFVMHGTMIDKSEIRISLNNEFQICKVY